MGLGPHRVTKRRKFSCNFQPQAPFLARRSFARGCLPAAMHERISEHVRAVMRSHECCKAFLFAGEAHVPRAGIIEDPGRNRRRPGDKDENEELDDEPRFVNID